MVGNDPSPKDVHIWIPRTYEYIRLQDIGKLRLQIELFANQLTLK